jgi:hypothetical protein
MSEQETGEQSVQEQLVRAARDLWSPVQESGETYVVFLDHRGLSTRVDQGPGGQFHLSWEDEDGSWVASEQSFENLREAAFHAYQGPH